MVSRVNFLETAPERIDGVARVVREVVQPGIERERTVEPYEVLFFDVPS